MRPHAPALRSHHGQAAATTPCRDAPALAHTALPPEWPHNPSKALQGTSRLPWLRPATPGRRKPQRRSPLGALLPAAAHCADARHAPPLPTAPLPTACQGKRPGLRAAPCPTARRWQRPSKKQACAITGMARPHKTRPCKSQASAARQGTRQATRRSAANPVRSGPRKGHSSQRAMTRTTGPPCPLAPGLHACGFPACAPGCAAGAAAPPGKRPLAGPIQPRQACADTEAAPPPPTPPDAGGHALSRRHSALA